MSMYKWDKACSVVHLSLAIFIKIRCFPCYKIMMVYVHTVSISRMFPMFFLKILIFDELLNLYFCVLKMHPLLLWQFSPFSPYSGHKKSLTMNGLKKEVFLNSYIYINYCSSILLLKLYNADLIIF